MTKEMKVINCSCNHPYQDKRYGIGKRVGNSTKKENTYRCTVCGKETQGRVES